MTHTTEQLEAMLAAANARADQARDAALVEAAGVANKAMCKFALATYQNDEGRMQNAASTYCADEIRVEILALRDKPAPAVVVPTTTVRESYVMEGRHPNRQEARDAAKVLMNCNGADINDWSDDIWPDDDCIAALRAIAGGGDE